MSYNKTIWTDGDVITSEKLNNIENGIEKASIMVVTVIADNSGEETVCLADKTYEEIVSALYSGIYVMAFVMFPNGWNSFYPCKSFSGDEHPLVVFMNTSVGENCASMDGFNVTSEGWEPFTLQYPPQHIGMPMS